MNFSAGSVCSLRHALLTVMTPLIIVAHDAWFYWTHRALHHRRWFRAVHGRHHASLHPTPWAAYAFHPVEALVQAVFLPLFLLFVPMHEGAIAVFLVAGLIFAISGAVINGSSLAFTFDGADAGAFAALLD